VLLVIGLLAGLLSTAWTPDKRGVLRLESERLAQLLDLATAESRLSGKAIAWTADAGQYRFWQLAGDSGWSEIRDRELFRARTLPQGIAIKSLRIENTRPQAVMRLEFNPYGPARSFHMEVSLGEESYLVAASPIGEIRAAPASKGGE
jgi:general secretion pathway protein H